MKKILLTILSLFVLTSGVFAADIKKSEVDTYVVIEIIGSANYEVEAGKFDKLAEGQKLNASTVIKPKLNSVVKISINGDEFEIKLNNKNYPISYFYNDSKSRKGLRIQTIAKSDAVDSATGVREGVATASSRASEAKEDFTWEE